MRAFTGLSPTQSLYADYPSSAASGDSATALLLANGAVAGDPPSFADTLLDFRDGLLRDIAQSLPIVGSFIQPDSSLRNDKNAYETGRGIGLLTNIDPARR